MFKVTMDQWLIRTKKNEILGPFPKSTIQEKVISGELDLEDEVCPANGYWFSIGEREEVRKLLGVEAPRPQPSTDQEATLTETPVLDDPTDPHFQEPTRELASSPKSGMEKQEAKNKSNFPSQTVNFSSQEGDPAGKPTEPKQGYLLWFIVAAGAALVLWFRAAFFRS